MQSALPGNRKPHSNVATIIAVKAQKPQTMLRRRANFIDMHQSEGFIIWNN